MHQPPGCWTDRGRRPTNQDTAIHLMLGEEAEVAAVADGMGGHQAGEVASREALEALVAALRRGEGLRDAIRVANDVVYDLALQSPELRGMGTTLVAFLRRGREYEIANVGDSRAYRIEDGEITLITRDHSFVAEAIASGQLTEEEARRSRWRNALTRAVGTDPDVEADIFGPFAIERPHTILLCSDGLYRWLEEAEVPALIAAAPALEPAAALLGRTALQGGSDDNITALLVGLRPPLTPSESDVPPRARLPRTLAGPDRSVPALGAETDSWPRQLEPPRRHWLQWRRWEPVAFVIVVIGMLAGLLALLLRLQ